MALTREGARYGPGDRCAHNKAPSEECHWGATHQRTGLDKAAVRQALNNLYAIEKIAQFIVTRPHICMHVRVRSKGGEVKIYSQLENVHNKLVRILITLLMRSQMKMLSRGNWSALVVVEMVRGNKSTWSVCTEHRH